MTLNTARLDDIRVIGASLFLFQYLILLLAMVASINSLAAVDLKAGLCDRAFELLCQADNLGGINPLPAL